MTQQQKCARSLNFKAV